MKKRYVIYLAFCLFFLAVSGWAALFPVDPLYVSLSYLSTCIGLFIVALANVLTDRRDCLLLIISVLLLSMKVYEIFFR